MPCPVNCSTHLIHHLSITKRHPTMTLAGTIDDLSFIRWIGPGKKIIQQMNSVVQKVLVRLANPDREFASKLRAERLPVLLAHHSQVVFLPVLSERAIDLSGLLIP